jgi:hypothetical protein
MIKRLPPWVNEPHSYYLSGSDADGDSLTFSITSDPLHGSLSGHSA